VEDVPVRVALGEGGTELVLVPSDLGGKPGITARVVRTGEAFWHQPLDAPPAARPVVVGKRVYVPVLDDAGTVVEIEAGTGNRLSHIPLQQRLGAGIFRQPGTGLVYVVAEGRRVFVLDVEPHDADGNREPMRCVQVLATDHPDNALRAAPVLTGPAGDAPAPRFLVLAQADDTQATKIRAFAVPPVTKGRKEEGAPPEVAPAAAGAVTVPGHVWFQPASDGERVAVVTDAGTFALYGTNQPGNQDAGLFPVPSAPLPADPKAPSPGQVVYAEEDDFWVISRGNLFRLRLALTAAAGLQVAPSGVPRPAGVPVHRPQLNSRRDTVVAVVRSDESDGVRAVAFDPRDGRVKWQQKLGAVPPAAPVPMGDGSALLVDEDGGVYVLPPEAAAVADAGTRAIAPGWVAARPTLAAAGVPKVAASADGKVVWVLVPERVAGGARQLRVRRFADGKMTAEAVVALPDRFAGDAVAVGETVVFPLADGFVRRFEPGQSKLVEGPQWRGEGVSADAECFLAAAGGDEFVGSDGGRRVGRWRWPSAAGSEWRPVPGGPVVVRDRVAFAPAVFALGETARRMLVADRAGNVWLYDADKAGDPLFRWRGTADGPIPAGEPTGGFVLVSAGGKPRVVYGVANRHVVCLDPGKGEAAPAWVVRGADGQAELLGWSAGSAGQVVVTDQSGRVTVYAAADGKAVATVRPELPDLFPQADAVAFAGDRLLLPLWDGSAVFLATAAR
jgi:outer membrane protein assembly factor BamB